MRYALVIAVAIAFPSWPQAMHNIHQPLDCGTCHVPVSAGSVMLKRPGHDQCKTCHADAFQVKDRKLCSPCHSGDALLPFPRNVDAHDRLSEFSHAAHADSKARIDPATGYRADCAFCHTLEANGVFAKFPTHTECAGCHAKEGVTPRLVSRSKTADCRGCHSPQETIKKTVVSGKYKDITFSHIAHLKAGGQCTTCHASVPRAASVANLTLPAMVDCMGCHDTSKALPVNLRMSNCGTCHSGTESGSIPASHTRNVKPAFHTESFRARHETEASAPDAKCFACHQGVTPERAAKQQCLGCHQIMRPASHTARWKDDVHGKYAALDRTACATCHAADYCSRCHNETPRSHIPLAFFKAGSHAQPAMLNLRSCLTCHTFANTCAGCHTRGLK